MATAVAGRFGENAHTDLVERLREALNQSQPGDYELIVRSLAVATGTGGSSAREVYDNTTAVDVVGVDLEITGDDGSGSTGGLLVLYSTPPAGNMIKTNLPAVCWVMPILPPLRVGGTATSAGAIVNQVSRSFVSAKSVRYVAFVADCGATDTSGVKAVARLRVADSAATTDVVAVTAEVADV